MLPNRRKIDSRAGTRKSGGRETPATNAISFTNAIGRELHPHDAILDSECSQRFEQILAAHLEQFRPAGAVELDLVRAMSLASWRLELARAMETRLISDEMEQTLADSTAVPPEANSLIAQGFVKALENPHFDDLGRYQDRLSREFTHAFRSLNRLRHAARLSGATLSPIQNGVDISGLGVAGMSTQRAPR